ncbi:amylo-alpha-1,6-glucosidase [Methanolobus mangrovi]|uniref:Amylo-alpha-1,6-glucosidase n=1 Tax=Methanolobus mangrovi TaxID=3072977 RepID=A0AA51UHF1_9EURY|nr:amylo-alpha-1,6-glucosidase [Methanolobus mangrovi]WMW23278.1 amylo-alpha-1,6-glucosidase [Methanolobus mangrovi]
MNYTDYIAGTGKEWIITNGLGGYASSTVIGANTRKYHGLLIASVNPPVERKVLLSSLDEELIIGENILKLAVHRYPDTIYPHGNEYLEDFSVEPFPTFLYKAGGLTIKKQIIMVHGENTSIVRYEINNPSGKHGTFRILPLINNRSIHQMTSSKGLSFMQETFSRETILNCGNSSFKISSDLPYKDDEHWYYNFEYEVELSRGYTHIEDNFNPGYFDLEINGTDTSCFIVASTEIDQNWDIRKIQDLFRNEEKLQEELVQKFINEDIFLQKLTIAGDSFIVDRRSTGSRSIIAGYHWFGDWGRDTMISLPGLTLATGRFNDARSILSTFAAHCKDGLIPNLFPENSSDSPVYNTADASLWFVHAIGRYLDYTGDIEFIESMWPTIESILNHYRNGTAYDIKMADDGLIEHAGQLTWMDAKIGDWEVTPRRGKVCEINALWYNALIYATKIGKQLGKDVYGFQEIAGLTKSSFNEKFWNDEKNCLYDCISVFGERSEKDASIRPNQILAVSLPHTMLSHEMEKAIVDKVTEDLLTPYGLRTLSPYDSRYAGQYKGNPETRDAVYHNGTVWPWLLGPYITAYAKVYRNMPDLKDKLRAFLYMIEKHMDEACIGTISEVFDGDMPHSPGGCVSQAWSVAEIMRCYVEDILPE